MALNSATDREIMHIYNSYKYLQEKHLTWVRTLREQKEAWSHFHALMLQDICFRNQNFASSQQHFFFQLPLAAPYYFLVCVLDFLYQSIPGISLTICSKQ